METLCDLWIQEGERRAEQRVQLAEQRARDGLLTGFRAGVEGLLAVRFPAESSELQAPLASWQDADAMSALLSALRNGESLDAVRQRIAAVPGE